MFMLKIIIKKFCLANWLLGGLGGFGIVVRKAFRIYNNEINDSINKGGRYGWTFSLGANKKKEGCSRC